MTIKDKLLRSRVMETHINLIRSGNYGEARLVLRLLNNGHIKCGLDDDAFRVESKMEKLGCAVRYSRNYNFSIVYLTADKKREWK